MVRSKKPSTDRAPAARATVALVLGVALGLTSIAAAQAPIHLDTTALERTEELSESLANDLLELSIAARDRNLAAVADFLAADLVAPSWAVAPTTLHHVHDWLWSHDWSGAAPAPGRAPQRFVDAFATTLDHFQSLEDVRFKVKGADFADPQRADGRARVQLQIHGRDGEGRREWLVAWLGIRAIRPDVDSGWRIVRLDVESMESRVAQIDVFSEVALPAGLRARFPDFGTPPNDTVIAHGAAVGDVDGDGLQDLLATGVVSNRLYLNDGAGGFRDVSADTLVDLVPPGTGALLLDGDNDGDLDVFLAAVGRQIYLQNRLIPEGNLRFVDVSARAGVDVAAIGFSAATADVNGDGAPDIYVASYNRYGVVMPDHWHDASNGTPNLLFVNRGDGTFREEAARWGVRDGRWSYAAGFADVDADGDQDLYVANDFGLNALYRNEGERFVDVASDAGVLDPGNGMGVAFGDYDNDGDLDLHVTNMSSTAGNRILSRLFPNASGETTSLGDAGVLRKLAAGNSLYRNDGDGSFTDVSAEMGGLSAGWAWGGGFIDVDNDGWEDLYAPNGFISGKSMNDT